jgi:DNA-binding protein HU-beta
MSNANKGASTTDLIANVASNLDMSKKDAKVVVESVLTNIKDLATSEGRLQVAGLGIFNVTERAARDGVNPQTGAKIKIKATKVVGMKAAQAFKDQINGK